MAWSAALGLAGRSWPPVLQRRVRIRATAARTASGLENGPVVSLNGMRALAEQWTKALNIRAINSNARVIELSGGNQQKVVIAKALVQVQTDRIDALLVGATAGGVYFQGGEHCGFAFAGKIYQR